MSVDDAVHVSFPGSTFASDGESDFTTAPDTPMAFASGSETSSRSSVLAKALGYQRLIDSSVELRMLRGDNLAIAAAVIGAHFHSASERIATEDFHEQADADLELLRDRFDIGQRSAKSYCDDWRHLGLLIRRAAVRSRGEVYEASAETFAAIHVLDALQAPHMTLTQSRLVGLTNAIRQLSVDTDPDVTRRIEALEREREAIDREIARVRSGETTTLDERTAVERVNDILQQVEDIPADFGRVRARFEALNRELRAGILASGNGSNSVLDDIFRGVDLIRDSDEGRTFAAFSDLLRDPEQSAALDAGINAILERDFSGKLPWSSRHRLRWLVSELKQGSRDVDATLTDFARGLRMYVLSQEFQRDRALRESLRESLSAAHQASTRLKPTCEMVVAVDIPTIQISSIGAVRLHDPSEFDAGTPLPDAGMAYTDFSVLAERTRESEIDFRELTDNVNDVVRDHASATVSQVLASHPASQGLASIVGLLSLAARHGYVDRAHVEELAWLGSDEVERSAWVPVHGFNKTIDEVMGQPRSMRRRPARQPAMARSTTPAVGGDGDYER